ncbi:MAG: 7,8-dihydro-6-hydroxymethylpterin dimethyltransferase [Candidatus Methanohalarchaeum thermophilum]|uniref:7,8-dihydro-6-hydroxymethylpterin dimethyltransferase n=1 Tax=Methanohalarchaeum thermophilum TaxID=1903181 RepID=A0A1Q6DS65_METT1|nr:MAG: 7,8-dihydro-6-hydroxymethylpterin dimethyltransferase [Candidatus Methanohalarchaeum thermophilum]
MLPKQTTSICPECNKKIEAEIFEKDDEVWIKKRCPKHGEFKDVYWSDVDLYKRAHKYSYDGRGISNPQKDIEDGCPYDCGLCDNHFSHTCLANIDLTNRCNLNCSFCFAHAKARGYVYEPSFDQVVEMLKLLRKEKPIKTPAVQFSGGEPTLRDDLLDIIEKAKDLGFLQIQIATNGIKLGKNKELSQDLIDAGLNTVYLHFDGTEEDVEPFIETKKQAIENCREAGLGIVLVPTIIKGQNEDEIGKIVDFAAENIDIIRGVNFQPIAFTGAAQKSQEERLEERFTIPDLAEELEKSTEGEILKDDLYPVPSVIPISKAVEALTDDPQIEFSCHPNCGAATYVFLTEDGYKPINRFIDVDKFFKTLENLSEDLESGFLHRVSERLGKSRAIAKALRRLNKSINYEKQPEDLELGKKIKKIIKDHNYDALGDFHLDTLFIGSMHFQDSYNYDLERLKRCVIHYATPDGRIIPFCAYNSGPTYREEIEKKFSVPVEEWEKRKGKLEKIEE